MRILIVALFAVSALFAKVSVSVSVIPQAFFVQKIAGNLVEVNIMVQKGKSPETYEPSLKELQKLSESQIYFTIGMPFEHAWLRRFESANPNLKIIAPLEKGELEAYLAQYGLDEVDWHFHKDLGESSANQNADSLESSASLGESKAKSQDLAESTKSSANLSIDSPKSHESQSIADSADSTDSPDSHLDSQGIHRHYPHIWLSFMLSKAHAQVIAKNLCEIDAPNCAIYEKNLARFEKEINKMFAYFKGIFGRKGGAFLVYHPAFSYIANELGLKEIAIEKDGKEAKIAHTKEILELIKKHNIKKIFIQPQFSTKNARAIAKEAKLSIKTADPLAFDWFENVNAFLSEVAKD